MYGFIQLKNGGLEWLLNDVGFIPNLTFNIEKLVFYSFWNPSVRVQACVCVCMYKTCVRSFGTCVRIRAYAYTCPRVSQPLFLKNSFILFIKQLYFPQEPSSCQFIILSGPKPTLDFRILPSLRNEGSSRKGYKMRYLHECFD